MKTQNLSQWISENRITSFFAGVFLLSIPVYTLIYLGEFTNEHVQSRLCLIASYSSALSAILVTKISDRTKVNGSITNQWILFAGAFIICGAVEWIDHIVWNHNVTLLLIFIDVIFVSLVAYVISRILSNYSSVRELMGRFLKIRIGIKWIALSIIFWPVLVYFSNMLAEWLGYTVATPASMSNGRLIMLAVESFFWYMFFGGPMNEEAGWRGFALVGLQKKYSPLWASIIVGFVWGVWHIPVHLLGFYPYGALGAVIRIFAIPLAIIFTWLFNRTKGSLIPVLLLHTAINTTSLFLPRHFIISSLVMTGVALVLVFTDRMWKKKSFNH
jgi:membrane protease YdiL (CAAX protease family)